MSLQNITLLVVVYSRFYCCDLRCYADACITMSSALFIAFLAEISISNNKFVAFYSLRIHCWRKSQVHSELFRHTEII